MSLAGELVQHEQVIARGLGTFCETGRHLHELRADMAPEQWATYCRDTLNTEPLVIDDLIAMAVSL